MRGARRAPVCRRRAGDPAGFSAWRGDCLRQPGAWQHRPDSDADVAVLLNGEHQRRLTTALAMADVAYDVLLDPGINISPLPVWLDEWEHPETFTNPALLHNIVREGVRL